MTSSAIGSAPGTDLTSLAQARFALVGFAPDESPSIVAALAEWRSLSRLFSPESTPRPSEIDSYSAVILNLTSALSASSWTSGPRLLDLKAPLLAIGACEDVNAFPAIQLNASEILFRPFSTRELAVQLQRCIARTGLKGGNAPQGRAPRVLIADDDPSIVALVSGVLRSRGLECHEAKNGRHALELARTLIPDLLILDINMPFVNGFDVLSALRGDPSTSAMNILMLTGADRQEDVIRGIELGASAYLCKPFQPFDFVLRIKDLLPGVQDSFRGRTELNLDRSQPFHKAHAVPVKP